MATSLVSTGLKFPDATIQTTAAQPTSMVLLATVNASAAATLSSPSSFSSTYNSFMIVLSEIEAASGSPRLHMRVAVGGTIVTGGSAIVKQAATSVVDGSDFSSTGDYIETTYDTNSLNSGKSLNGFFYVFNANSTTAEKALYGQTFFYNQGTLERQSIVSSGRFITNASVVSGISFHWQGGQNFRAIGNMKVYGLLA